MNIALTGATGMLGQSLCKVFAKHQVFPLSSRDLNITSLTSVRQVFSELNPDWIIHTAAFTNVNEAESNPTEAYQVNALGTRNVAVTAQENNSRLLYYSTDYVFDGQLKRPYHESDPVAPLNEYGRSKFEGERFVRSLCPSHLIIRTSWLFGPGKTHFVAKILNLAKKQSSIQVVEDQHGSPTFTNDLAYMTLLLVEGNKCGTYHVTNSGECSRYEFASQIISLKEINVSIIPITSSVLASTVPRPCYSTLDNFALKMNGIPLLRTWQKALYAFMQE